MKDTMNATVQDLRATIIPKTDQLNFDQFVAGPMVIKVTRVEVATSKEQPVIVHYEGESGRPYKPNLTMRKVLVLAWGANGDEWVGKSMELYGDPAVRFGNETVGGIRIACLSDIPKDIRVSLAVSKGKKAMYEIGVLTVAARDTDRLMDLIAGLDVTAAAQGTAALGDAWKALSAADRKALGTQELERLKAMATRHDEQDQPPKED